jgi:hypothetical protein
VSVIEPYGAAGLPPPGGGVLSAARGAGWPASAGPGPGPGAGPWLPGAVSPLEPAEWLLVARGRRLLGSAARKVLGPRAPAVRAYFLRAWLRTRQAVKK